MGGQTFCWEGRIIGLSIIKGPHLLKSKEYYLHFWKKILSIQVQVFIFYFLKKLPRVAQNGVAGCM